MIYADVAIKGIRKSADEFAKSAQKISNFNLKNDDFEIEDKVTLSTDTDDTKIDIAKEFVKMELSEICYKANVQVLKTSDEMTGKLIDIKV